MSETTTTTTGTVPDVVLEPEAPVAQPARWRGRKHAPIEAGLIIACAAALTAFGWDRFGVTVVPLAVAALLLGQIAALPAYDRWTSLQPIKRTLVVGGAALLTVAYIGWFDLPELRAAIGGMLLVAGVPLAFRGASRLLRRPRSTLLLGDRLAVSHLVAQWESQSEVRIVGLCLTSPDDDAEDQPVEIAGYPVLGGLDDAVALAQELKVDQVVVAPGPVVTAYDVRRLSWAFEQTNVELAVAAEVHGAVPRRIDPRLLGRRLLLSVRPARRPVLSLLVKSLGDRLLAGVLLLLVSPILIGLVLLVRSDSPGPGFFRQTRAGQGGRPFTMYKLRTMRVDAEARRAELAMYNEAAGPLFKIADDPRITRVGRFLRRSSLDELPQLINVIQGRMSLIGPRPALLDETYAYDDWIRRRLVVKPGMTGLWQVSGRSRLRWNESVRLDLDYVDNWTLRSDLDIARKTIGAVTRSDGAS